MNNRPSNPKQSPTPKGVTGGAWYPYYAGYSPAFVRDTIGSFREHYGVTNVDLIVDPWNGAGTTTQVASDMGMSFWGGDVNPAMVVVAKARLLNAHITPSQISLCERVLNDAADHIGDMGIENDPLRQWFTDATASALRAIESQIALLFDPGARDNPLLTAVNRVSEFSALTSFFYLALFRATRQLLESFRASNPTWVKSPRRRSGELDAPRVSLPFSAIRSRFSASVSDMVDTTISLDFDGITNRPETALLGNPGCPIPPNIHVASSTTLPLKDNSAAAVVASPPYCTRIDYAVTTGPELAILGMGEQQWWQLRDKTIGTSTIRENVPDVAFDWGDTCTSFLCAVGRHPSKASVSYYLKNHLQYFADLAKSLLEIDRVLRPGSPCVLVVQDSYYKDLHNDLPSIVIEMGEALGWHCGEPFDYEKRHHMARINTKAQKYRQHPTATEYVLPFRTHA